MTELAWESESGQQRVDRRSRLRELDHILEVLEGLNLDGRSTVPEEIRAHLFERGIVSLPNESPSIVLERVLLGQEVFLLHPSAAVGETLRRPKRPVVPPLH